MIYAALCILAGTLLFYRVGYLEYGAGIAIAGMSMVLGLFSWFVLKWGGVGYLGLQLFLLGVLTWYNLKWRNRRSK